MILQWILTLSLGLLVNAVPPMRLSHSGYEVISFAGQKNDDPESSKISRNFPKMSGYKLLEIAKPSDDSESLVPRQDRKIHYENGRSNPKQNTVDSLYKDQNPSSYPTKFAFKTNDQDQSDTLQNNHHDKSIGITPSKNIDPKYPNPAIKNDTEKHDTPIQDPDFDYSDIRTVDTKQDKPGIFSDDPQQDEKDKQDKSESPKQPLPTITKFLPGPRGFFTLQKSANLISPIYPAGHDVTSHRPTYKSFPLSASGLFRSQDDSLTRHKYSPMIQDDFESPREFLRQNIAREKSNKFLLLNSLKHFLLKNKIPYPRALMTPPLISFGKSIPFSASSPRHFYPSISSLELHPMPMMTSPMELSVSRRVQHRTGDPEPKDISGSAEISKGSLIIDIVHEMPDDSEIQHEPRINSESKSKPKDPCPLKGKNEFYEFLTKFGSNVMETALRYETSIRTDLPSSYINPTKRSLENKNHQKSIQ